MVLEDRTSDIACLSCQLICHYALVPSRSIKTKLARTLCVGLTDVENHQPEFKVLYASDYGRLNDELCK